LVLTGRGWQQLLPSLYSVGGFTVTRNLIEATAHILKSEICFPNVVDVWSVPPLAQQRRQSLSAIGGF
jgi:hypothetical protein